MDLTFTAVFEEVSDAEGGGFVAYAEELPGAITQGETLEEARDNLCDAIEVLLEANRALAQQAQAGRNAIQSSAAETSASSL